MGFLDKAKEVITENVDKAKDVITENVDKVEQAIDKAAGPDDPFERLATRAEREIARAVYDLLSGLPDTAWARELRRRLGLA